MPANPDNADVAAHPSDLSAEDLQNALAAQKDPVLLSHLVELSRDTFGFFTNLFPQTINYPWVLERLRQLPRGARVLDIGAGVSPVPLFLAEKGMTVDCVDNSRHIRQLPFAASWNEWGFFDYGALSPRLTSHHCDVTEFTPAGEFAAIYSIAALAHTSRSVRENALRRTYDWLLPQGFLLLTIDVIPSTDFIWNRCEGQEVEPPIQHGTINDVLDQLCLLGFRVEESRVMRTVYKSRTDLLFIACRKRADEEQ